MPTIEVSVRRVSVVSSRPFDEVVQRLTATIGHPDMSAFHNALAVVIVRAGRVKLLATLAKAGELSAACALMVHWVSLSEPPVAEGVNTRLASVIVAPWGMRMFSKR